MDVRRELAVQGLKALSASSGLIQSPSAKRVPALSSGAVLNTWMPALKAQECSYSTPPREN